MFELYILFLALEYGNRVPGSNIRNWFYVTSFILTCSWFNIRKLFRASCLFKKMWLIFLFYIHVLKNLFAIQNKLLSPGVWTLDLKHCSPLVFWIFDPQFLYPLLFFLPFLITLHKNSKIQRQSSSLALTYLSSNTEHKKVSSLDGPRAIGCK